MNFTREPIILTVVTPREGNKLIIRNVLGGQEDIFVDAIEVVSFGEAIFFRSLERPKSFLFPTSHYEIIEVKETRMVLKNATAEKSIKIGGGMKSPEEKRPEEKRPEDKSLDDRRDRKKDKKRLRRRKPSTEEITPLEEKQGGEVQDETAVSSSTLKKLFPPPNVLIKERLARFKNEEFFEKNILPESIEEKKDETTESFDEKQTSENKEGLQEKESSDDDLGNEKKENDREDLEE